MSLLYIDGFDHFDPQAPAPGGGPNLGYNKAAYSSALTRVAGRRAGSWALRFPANAGNPAAVAFTRTTGTGRSTLLCGAAIRFDALPPDSLPLLYVKASTGSRWELVVSFDGTLSIARSTWASRTILGTAWRQVTGDVWHHYELRLVEGAGTGIAEARVDGQSWLVLTGLTVTTGSQLVAAGITHPLQPTDSTWEQYPVGLDCDDFYLADNAGTVNNTLLGDVRVDRLAPNGPGTYAQWTLTGAASNWEAVDDPDPIHTDYVEALTTGLRDSYAFESLPAMSAPSVLGVQSVALARKSDAGAGALRSIAKLGATIAVGATHAPATDPAYYTHVFERTPLGATWTEADLASAEFGVETV